MKQATESVKAMIKRGDLLEMAVDARAQSANSLIDESQSLASMLRGKAYREELLSEKQMIELAKYFLEYHVDYVEIAKYAYDMIDGK